MDALPFLEARYSAIRWKPVAEPGFSGARVWSGSLNGELLFALKRWPVDVTLERLKEIHLAMRKARSAGCSFVPNANDIYYYSNHAYDIVEWMPGRADFDSNPNNARLISACDALKHLHKVWSDTKVDGKSPSVERRQRVLLEWESEPILNRVEQLTWRSGYELVNRLLPTAVRRLDHCNHSLPLQLCVCDIWHDHILFNGDRVTGIIDYGAIRIDTPATDVARMLGDLVGDRRDLWELGVSQFTDYPRDPILVLALAGTLGSAIHWLRRWSEQGSLPIRGMARLTRIIHRLEQMSVG